MQRPARSPGTLSAAAAGDLRRDLDLLQALTVLAARHPIDPGLIPSNRTELRRALGVLPRCRMPSSSLDLSSLQALCMMLIDCFRTELVSGWTGILVVCW